MNIPKLRFKDNNDNDYPQWEKKKLGDIGNIISGGTPSSSNKEYWNGHINWFTPSEVGKTKFVSESIRKITEKGLKNSSAKLLPKGTILLSSRATIGEKSILLNSATTNQGFQSIITNNEAINEFIYYHIDTLKSELIKQSSGSTFLEISNTILKKLKIYIPNLQEQEKIANFLSTVDKKIENLANTITSLENQKKGLLQQIFSQKLRFKDKNGNNYPNWEKKKLGQYINYKKGYAFKSELYTNKGIRIIRVSDLSATSIKNDSPIYISRSLYTNYLDWKLYTNDIIITTVGSKPPIYDSMVGKVILFPDNLPYKCFLNQNAVIIRACTQVNQKFLYYTLSLNKYINHIKNILRGNANQANITLVDLFEYKIPLPCLEEQTKIADFLSAFDRKLNNQKAQLEHWKQIKKGLLQQMFV